MGVCGDDDDDDDDNDDGDDVFRMSRVCVGDSAGGTGNLSWASKSRERAEELSDTELEAVTTVFRSFETGLREASIDTKVG